MTDREEQVKRLAGAIAQVAIPAGQSASMWMEFAEKLHRAGARIPDPPPPRLPVVSEAAVKAAWDASQLAGPWHMADTLRAAWPFMVRDTVNALPRYAQGRATGLDLIEFGDGPLNSNLVSRSALIRTLTGGAP